ncbi:MAG: hypothetical protein ACFFED_14250 [Candidatus Thorarchaeota archaeon]
MTDDPHIKDQLQESILLGGVRLILSEYLPCDRNTLEAINQKLMSKRTMHGEFVTMLMDAWPESTTFTSERRCNSVRIIESNASESISCEASMQDPSDEVEQKEVIGMHITHEGHMVYGCEITAIYDKPITENPSASLDHLARIIADMMNDSSLLMDTLLTHHQRRILDCIFKGTPNSRYKFIGLMASSMAPVFSDVASYIDGEEYQNELEQIIDNIQLAEPLSEKDSFLFLGAGGILIVSPEWMRYETLITFYSLLRSSEIFVDGLFNRMSLLSDELNQARTYIEKTSEGDYTVITKAQNILTEATANYTILGSTGGYLERGFRLISDRWNLVKDQVDSSLRNLIGIDRGLESLIDRIRDIELVLNSIKSEVEGLQTLLSTQIEQQMRRVYSALRDNTRNTSEVIKASERTGDVLDVIQLVLSGTIAFDIVIAFTGEYTTPLASLSMEYPLVFFISAILLWLVIVVGLKKSMDYLGGRIEKEHMIRHTLNIRCNPANVEAYLNSKTVISVDEEVQEGSEMVRTHYLFSDQDMDQEATVTLSYDRKNGVIEDLIVESKGANVVRTKERILRELEDYLP